MARFNTYSQIISNQNTKTNDEEDDENLDLEDVVLDEKEMENQFAHLEPTKEEEIPVKAIFKEIRIEIGDEIKVSEL